MNLLLKTHISNIEEELPCLSPQKFSSHSHKSTPIINAHFKNLSEKNKTAIFVFFNKEKKSDYDNIFQKFLSIFTNYNNVGELQPFNINIIRNFKHMGDILKARPEEDGKFSLFFFKKMMMESLKLMMIFHATKVLRNEIFEDNSFINFPNISKTTDYFNFILRAFKNSGQGEEEEKKGSTSLIHLFAIAQQISEPNEQSSEIMFLYPMNEVIDEIYKDIGRLFKEQLNSEKNEKAYFFKKLQKSLLKEALCFEKVSEVLVAAVLIKVVETLKIGKNLTVEEIKEIINEFQSIVDLRVQEQMTQELQEIFGSYVLFLHESLCKMLDGDIGSCVFLQRVYFEECLIYSTGFNPVIVSLLFNIYKLKSLKKNPDESFYKEGNLPLMTVIFFEGWDSIENYYLLKNTKNIQIISIFFDENTLRVSEEIQETLNEYEKTRMKKHYNLIPLRSKIIDEENYNQEINSKDIIQIFTEIVFPLISSFHPSLILMTINMEMGEGLRLSPMQEGFRLSPKSFSIITYNLGLLCNHKLLLVPVVSCRSESRNFENYQLYKNSENKKAINLPESLINRYMTFWKYKSHFGYFKSEEIQKKRLYIYELMGAFFNVVGGNIKKEFLELKTSYFSQKYSKNTKFFDYFLKIIKKKFRYVPFLQKKNIDFQNNFLKALDVNKTVKKPKGMEKELQNPPFIGRNMFPHKKKENIVIYELVLPNKSKFFYCEQTTYCVHYDRSKIFFLNNPLTTSDPFLFENFTVDFDQESLLSRELIVNPMPFYNKDQSIPMFDFSVCFSRTHLFLIWGREKNSQKINQNILAYEIDKQRWCTIKLETKNNRIIPRLRTTSVCFSLQKHSHIYVLGGFSEMSANQSADIYNIVDYIVLVEGVSVGFHQQLEKSSYHETYKPLWDAQLIALPVNSNDKIQKKFEAILFGGSFSKFIFNQEKKPLTIYHIAFNNDPERKVEFDNFGKFQNIMKKNTDGLNLLFASQSKNFLFKNDKIMLAPILFSKEESGLFLEFYSIDKGSNEFLTGTTFQDLGLNLYQTMTKSERYKEKNKKKDFKIKFLLSFIENVGRIECPIFSPCSKMQDMPYFLVESIAFLRNFFNLNKIFRNVFVEEDSSEIILMTPKPKSKNQGNKDELIVSLIGFYANTLMKANCNYFEYIPSQLKSSNFALKGEMLYILVNNEKDSGCKRILYSLNLSKIEKDSKRRVELTELFEHETSFLKGSSLICADEKLYIVGGEIQDKKKFEDFEEISPEFAKKSYSKMNFSYDLEKNKLSEQFASNMSQMINPWVACSKEYLFCIERRIVTVPFLELAFLEKIKENIGEDLKNLERGIFLYVEFIDIEEIERQKWKCFIVDLINMEIVLMFNPPDKIIFQFIKPVESIQNIVSSFMYLGQIPQKNQIVFLLLYKNKKYKEGRKQRKIICLDFEEILSMSKKQGIFRETKNKVQGIELNEEKWGSIDNNLLSEIRDLNSEEKEMNLFKLDLQKVCVGEELSKI